jgi:outer membrane protein assembly factor BamB/predicted AlkP superfamily pyrophosphatase or phosphodiesterase
MEEDDEQSQEVAHNSSSSFTIYIEEPSKEVADVVGLRTATYKVEIKNIGTTAIYNIKFACVHPNGTPFKHANWFAKAPERVPSLARGATTIKYMKVTAKATNPPAENSHVTVVLKAYTPTETHFASTVTMMNTYKVHIECVDPYKYAPKNRTGYVHPAVYEMKVTNKGKKTDTIDFVTTKPALWGVDFYKDSACTKPLSWDGTYYYITLTAGATITVYMKVSPPTTAVRYDMGVVYVEADSEKGTDPIDNTKIYTTSTISSLLFCVSDNDPNNVYGERHGVNPGYSTTFIIKVFRVEATQFTVTVSIPSGVGWNPLLIYPHDGESGTSVTVERTDIPKIGDYQEVILKESPPAGWPHGLPSTLTVSGTDGTISDSVSVTAVCRRDKKVYIINIDSMPYDYLYLDVDGGDWRTSGKPKLMPNLWKLIEGGTIGGRYYKGGSFYTNTISIMPSATDMNHVGIIASAHTAATGAVSVAMYYTGWDGKKLRPIFKSPTYKDVLVKTVYDEIKGLRTGVIAGKNWVADLFASPACEIVANGVVHPFYIEEPATYILGDPKSDKNATTDSPKAYLLGKAVGSLPHHFPSDEWIMQSAIEIIKHEDPDFFYILLANLDEAGHLFGTKYPNEDPTTVNQWAKPEEVMDVVREVDVQIGKFIDFLEAQGTYDNSIIVVTADHGMTTVHEVKKVEIDLKKHLHYKGIQMGKEYEYCLSMGSLVAFYNFKSKQSTAESLLESYTINGVNPIWKVLNQYEMQTAVNEHTGKYFNLYCRALAANEGIKGKVQLPDLLVIMNTEKGGQYNNVMYRDALKAGAHGLGLPIEVLPDMLKLTFVGNHGSWSEQHVPLIIRGPGIQANVENGNQYELLDIIPLICKLNKWNMPKATEGIILQGDWPMFNQGTSHTGYSYSSAPNTNHLAWCYNTNQTIYKSSPAVKYNRIYIGSYDTYIYCLDKSTGLVIWKYKTGDRIYSSPAVGYGKVFIGSDDKKIYCLDAKSGKMIWRYATGGLVEASPVITRERVYIASRDSNIYCFDIDGFADRKNDGWQGEANTGVGYGDVIWKYAAEDSIVGSSPVVAKGKVIIGCKDQKVYCLDADTGTKRWTFTTGNWVCTSAAIVNNKVYIGSWDDHVYCLPLDDPNRDGVISNSEIYWKYKTAGKVYSTPAVANGKVFVSGGNYVYCLPMDDPTPTDRTISDSEVIWGFRTGGWVESSPAVADGKVFVGSDDTGIYALAEKGIGRDVDGDGLKDTKLIWKYAAGGRCCSSIAVAGGMVFAAATDGTIYAFKPKLGVKRCSTRTILVPVHNKKPTETEYIAGIDLEKSEIAVGHEVGFGELGRYETTVTLPPYHEILTKDSTTLSFLAHAAGLSYIGESSNIVINILLFASPEILVAQVNISIVTVEELFGVNLTCAYPVQNVAPGVPAQYTVVVTNTGTQLDTIELTLSELPEGWYASLSTPSVTLMPREPCAVEVTVIPPPEIEDVNASTSIAEIVITARSTNDPRVVDTETLIAVAARMPTALTAYEAEVQYSDTVLLRARLTSFGVGLMGRKLKFSVDEIEIGEALTDENGYAALDYPCTLLPEVPHTITVRFEGDLYYLPALTTTNLTVRKEDSMLHYLGMREVQFTDLAELKAKLTDADSGVGIAGREVIFVLGTQTITATTDTAGIATALLKVQQQPAEYMLEVRFEGDAYFEPASCVLSFRVLRERALLCYTGATEGQYSDTVVLSAVLYDADNNGIPEREIIFTLGAQRVAALTDTAGVVSVMLRLEQPAGNYEVEVEFAGDAYYEPAATTAPFRILHEDTCIAYLGAREVQYLDIVKLIARLTDADSGAGIAGRLIEFELGMQFASASTDEAGIAAAELRLQQPPGDYTLHVRFKGDEYYMPNATSVAFTVLREDTVLEYFGDTACDYSDYALLCAKLTDADSGEGIAGREVTFVLGTQAVSARTDAEGVAYAKLRVLQKPGGYTLEVSFCGDGYYKPASCAVSFRVLRERTILQYVGATEGQYSDTVWLRAVLRDADNNGIAGRWLTFTLGTQSVSACTDEKGVAVAALCIAQPPGEYEVRVEFAGDTYYEPAETAVPFRILREDTVLAYVGACEGQYSDAVKLIARLTDADSGVGIAGRLIEFELAAECVYAETNDSGYAVAELRLLQPPGDYVLNVSFSGDEYYSGSDVTVAFSILREDTVLCYVGAREGQYTDEVELAAYLLDADSRAGISGRKVQFILGAQAVTAVTDATGLATAKLELLQRPGTYMLNTSFAGDTYYHASWVVVEFKLLREDTKLEYLGAREGQYSDKVMLLARLTDADSGVGIAGRSINFTLGTQQVSARTDAEGYAAAELVLQQQPAVYVLNVSFDGDAYFAACYILQNFTISKEDTVLRYLGALSGQYSDEVVLKAELLDADSGAGIPNRSVRFRWGVREVVALTDTAGVAELTVRLSQVPAVYVLNTSFEGDAYYLGSYAVVNFTLEKEDTKIVYTGALSGQYSDVAELAALLQDEDSGMGVGGRTLEFQLGVQRASSVTDSVGNATVALMLLQKPAAYTLQVCFRGDAYYEPASLSLKFTILREDTVLHYLGVQEAQYSDAARLCAKLQDADSGAGVAQRSVTFSIGVQATSTSTDFEGYAAAELTMLQKPAVYTLYASFEGDEYYLPSSTAVPFEVLKEDTKLIYFGDLAAQYTDVASLRAMLQDADSAEGIPGRELVFLLGVQSAAAVTLQDGVAVTAMVLQQKPGMYTLEVSFEGDAYYLPSFTAVSFEVQKEDTVLHYLGDLQVQYSDTAVLRARLTDADSGTGVSCREIAFMLAEGHVAAAHTSEAGVATAELPVWLKPAVYTLRAEFYGDEYFLPSCTEVRFEVLKEDTVLHYFGTREAQFTDIASLKAELADMDSGMGIAQRELWFGIGNQSVSALTAEDGMCIAALRVRQRPGLYRQEVMFHGDEYYLPSNVTMDFLILHEVMLLHVASAEGFTYDSVQLEAYACDDDFSSIWRWQPCMLSFEVDGSYAGAAELAGDGYATVSWAVDKVPAELTELYRIFVRFPGNDYYAAAEGKCSFVLKSARWLKLEALAELQQLQDRLIAGVGEELAALFAEVEGAAELHKGIRKSLLAKLEAADRKFTEALEKLEEGRLKSAEGKFKACMHKLEAFVHELEAQMEDKGKGKHLPRELAEDWLAAAAAIIEKLSVLRRLPTAIFELKVRLGLVEEKGKPLAEPLWVDASHLSMEEGAEVFKAERKAVQQLMAAYEPDGKLARPAPELKAELVTIILKILKADRLLAKIAIDAAVAAGVPAAELQDAYEALEAAEQAVAEEEYAKAVKYYGEAWEVAVESVK